MYVGMKCARVSDGKQRKRNDPKTHAPAHVGLPPVAVVTSTETFISDGIHLPACLTFLLAPNRRYIACVGFSATPDHDCRRPTLRLREEEKRPSNRRPLPSRQRVAALGACQVVDWHQDGHKTVCLRQQRALRLTPDPFSARERSFLQALVHDTYATTIPSLSAKEVVFMHDHPGETFYILVDYTAGYKMPQVRSVQSDAPPDSNPSEGSAIQCAICYSSSAYQDGLMHIVTEVPPDATVSAQASEITRKIVDLIVALRQRQDNMDVWQD
ncbi:hypothetical protein B0H19DRAFT_1064230 [Mycena capillaripes]|nr:hypothetical protein B0H19DRAFT_1064230 [Mycena capillaripes]